MTCAHVVNASLGLPLRSEGKPIRDLVVRFPLLEGTPARMATVKAWKKPPPDGVAGDIAGLVLGEPAPLGATPARLSKHQDIPDGMVLRAFGYPREPIRTEQGAWVYLDLKGEVGGRLIQVESRHDQSTKAQPGFSGSPVMSKDGGFVVGLLQATPSSDEQFRDAYLIPSMALARAWKSRFDYLLVPPNPYRGLEPFTTDDADVFFGRDREIGDLQKRVDAQPVTVVVGPSGVGKSSLIRAGLIPKLQRSSPWSIAMCRPGRDPWHRLSAALLDAEVPAEASPSGGTPPLVTREALERELHRLQADGLQGVGRYFRSQGRQLLVVIDQFEEALASDPPDQDLLDMLLPPPQRAAEAVHVVLTLRADFLPSLIGLPGMGNDRLGDRLHFLSGMTLSQMREAVQAPALSRGVRFQPGLLDRIVADASAGSLPLMQYTLMHLWDSQEHGKMTFSGYRALGGVAGALERFAEQQLALLGPDHQPTVDRLLLRLLRIREGDVKLTTRNRVHRSEVPAGHWQVLQQLTTARLVVAGVDTDRGPYAELAHEALIETWPRLSKVLADNATFLAWLGAVERRASDQDPLPEARIAEARAWVQIRPDDIPRRVRDFITASQAAVETHVRELEASTREAEAARHEAEDAQNRAEALRLAAQSELAYRGRGADSTSALRLAAASLHVLTTPEGIAAIRQAISITARQQSLPSHVGPTSHVAFVASGSQIASAGADGILRISQAATGDPVTAIGHKSPIVSLCSNLGGAWLAVGLRDGSAVVYRTADYTSEVEFVTGKGPVSAIAVDPTGELLVVCNEAGRLWLYELGSEDVLLNLRVHAPVSALALGADRRLAVGGTRGLHIYNLASTSSSTSPETAEPGNPMTATFESDVPVRVLALSRDGTLGLGCEDHSARVLSIPHEEKLRHRGPVVALDFSPDGQRLATASEDGTARVLDTETGAEVARLTMSAPVRAVAFAADTFRVVCASDDGSARVFEANTGNEVVRARHEAPVTAVAASPDGRRIASGSADGAVLTFSAVSGSERARLVHNDAVRCVEFDEHATHLATASLDGTARVLHVETGQELARSDHGAAVWCATVVSEGRTLVSGAADGSLRLSPIGGGDRSNVYEHSSPATTLAATPGRETLLACGHADGSVIVRQLPSGEVVGRFSVDGRVLSLVLATDGSRLVSGSDDGTCRVFDLGRTAEVGRFVCGDAVRSLALGLSDRVLAVGSWDNSASVFELDTLHRIGFVQHRAPVSAVALSADGATLASADLDGVATVTDLASGQPLTCIDHEAALTAIDITDDGSLLAIGSVSRLAVVTNIADNSEVTRLAHDGAVTSLTFSPAGLSLATGSADRTARVFTIDTNLLLGEADVLLAQEDSRGHV